MAGPSGSLTIAPVLYNGGMELLWDTVEVFAYVGWLLTLAFPLFAIAFIVLRRRYRKKLPSHRTMIVFVLIAICGVFCILSFPLLEIYLFPGGLHSLDREPIINLGNIHQLQIEYFGKYNTYAEIVTTANSNSGYFMPSSRWCNGKTIYSYYCGDDFIPAMTSLKEKSVIHDPDNNWPDGFPIPKISQQAFTCVAIGDIDNDDTFDVWSINDGSWYAENGIGGYHPYMAKLEIDDTGDDGTRTRGPITFKGRVYLRNPDGGIYFYVLGMLTPLLLLSIAFDIARALRLRREAMGED